MSEHDIDSLSTKEGAYNGWLAGQALSDLDLRAAAQWCQLVEDLATERAIDSELASRGQA